MKKKKESSSTFGIGLDGKMRVWVPPETTYFSVNSEKHSMSHNTRVTNTDEIRRERWHASSRARHPQRHFLLAAQARKLSLGGGRAVKCHPQKSDGGAAIEVLSVSVWVYPSVFVLFGIYVVAVITAVLLCVTHSESVIPVRAISEEEHYYGSCW